MTVYNVKDSVFPPVEKADCKLAKMVEEGVEEGVEEAVEEALKWLAAHQWPDGGWSFHHHLAPTCQGKCNGGGSMHEARIAATALGILPFLGAGQTHQMGQYKDTVKQGLYFLVKRMKVRPKGGKLNKGGETMYSHGLGAIALCEAYGMTGDKKLQRAAQAAINHIIYAQDPVGGGWRYGAQQAGDTSVSGWQIRALKSGRMAHLKIPPATMQKASHFLDSVQTDDHGSDYGYTHKDRPSLATQAIGLLSRLYLGWKPDHPGIVQGVLDMSRKGPSTAGNMYYNYYATQVMHRYGGEPWNQWNRRLRDWLVGSQSQAGHTTGSWHFRGGDRGADKGGRLYCTALAAMTLEVYYRPQPIFREQAAEDDVRQE